MSYQTFTCILYLSNDLMTLTNKKLMLHAELQFLDLAKLHLFSCFATVFDNIASIGCFV